MAGERSIDSTQATQATELERSGERGRTLLAIGRSKVSIFPLPEAGELIIGRSRGADLIIDDRSVSRRHARMVLTPDRITLCDLGSANGTRIGHEQVSSSPRPIVGGEPFHLGGVTLVIEGAKGGAARHDGESRDMAHLEQMAARLAAGTVSILIQGETGVGKERMAERIHALSPRAQAPFVRLNCAAIAETLIESELFGHEKGAFSGAHAAKPGLLEVGDGGTVFFDEIGELPLSMQVKLLRAVEEGAVRRVGGTEARAVDVRYLAATNRDLEAEVDAGRFRRDLYYRLAGATLFIPPLRERRGEIGAMAERFVGEAEKAAARGPLRLSDDALEYLVEHDWPGNVRQLRSACERAALVSTDGVLTRADFLAASSRRAPTAPPPVSARALAATSRPAVDYSEEVTHGRASRPSPPAAAEPLPEQTRRQVEELEKQRILEALDQAGGNQTRAAEILGISRRTLINRLDAYGLPRPRKR